MENYRIFFFLLLLAQVHFIDCINITKDGKDEINCIKNWNLGYSCKTLVYAMQQIADTDYGPDVRSVRGIFNVTYNQTIRQSHKFKFISPQFYVGVVGFKDVFLNFRPKQGIVIVHSEQSTWEWNGIGLACLDSSNTHCDEDHLTTRITHIGNSIKQLQFFQCKFIAIALMISNVQEFVLEDSAFGGRAHCPTVYVRHADNLQQVIKILSNHIYNCQFSQQGSVISINANSFTSIEMSYNAFSGLIGVNNSYLLYQSAISVVGNTAICMTNNMFTSSQRMNIVDIRLSPGPSTASASTMLPKVQLEYNRFQNNIYSHLMSIEAELGLVYLSDLVAVNNSGRSGLITVQNKQLRVQGNVSIEMKNLSLENNSGHIYVQDQPIAQNIETSVIFLSNINNLLLVNTTFKNNWGTSLLIEPGKGQGTMLNFCVLGFLVFQNNSGLLGGGLALNSVNINSSCKSDILFVTNSGVYGGALYLENTHLYSSGLLPCSTAINFSDNSARTAGNSVYFASTPIWNLTNDCLKNLSIDDVGTVAMNLSVHYSGESLKVFPGQNIILNTSITDLFGGPSSCMVNVIILCEEQVSTCYDLHIKLSGPDHVILAQTDNSLAYIDTSIMIQSPQHLSFNSISLELFSNIVHLNQRIPLNLTTCPQGFYYDSTSKVCKCAMTSAPVKMVCSTKFGAACIAHGYWYGKTVNESNFTEYTVARCTYPECRYTTEPCPSEMQSDGGYFKLSYESDSQCSYGRGGVLCKKCAQHFVFSFLSIKCILETNCSIWQGLFILFFGILFQVLIAITLLLVVRFRHSLGSGFLYGPMLFLAVVSHLPLDNYSEYSALSDGVSIITSVALLNLELFGRIPWCFFQIPKQYNYSLHFLGPLTVLIVLTSITFLARSHPSKCCLQTEKIKCMCRKLVSKFPLKCSCLLDLPIKAISQRLPQDVLQCWKAPPLKAVCILMLLSFWSLADTSINILTPTVFEFRESPPLYMVSIQPDIRYFSPQHLTVAIPALLVLLVLILPLVIVLLLSPFLQRVINLYRIMPFLDEFQSCYEDRYRWYSSVYFIVWIIIVSIQGLPDFLLFTQTIFIILLCAQFLIKPYKSKLLNITDTLLLVDINFLISLVYKLNYSSSSSYVHMFSNLLIHALVIVPFVCAIISVICVLVIKTGIYDCILAHVKRKPCSEHLQLQPSEGEQQQPSASVPMQEISILEHAHEREPLIALVSNL